jgi:mannan polymerase II complex MNN11 subunit
MHFAYPPRKSSTPPKFVPRSSTRIPILRRSRAKLIAVAGLAFIALIYLLTRTGGRRHGLARHPPSGKPPVVIVTVIDESHNYPPEYLESVRENRIQYAEKHGTTSLFHSARPFGAQIAHRPLLSLQATKPSFPN